MTKPPNNLKATRDDARGDWFTHDPAYDLLTNPDNMC
jgi:hypothetical protein